MYKHDKFDLTAILNQAEVLMALACICFEP